MRHPGYGGMALQTIGMPLFLGSLWALVPAVVAAALLVVRTTLEDRMLRTELDGYEDYVRNARYRLLPGIW